MKIVKHPYFVIGALALCGCGDGENDDSGCISDRFTYQYDMIAEGRFALLIIDKETKVRVMVGDDGVTGSIQDSHFRAGIDSTRFSKWSFDLHDDNGLRIQKEDRNGDLKWD
jgi:hypothetical protein